MRRIGYFVLLMSVGPGAIPVAQANIGSRAESIRTQAVARATEGGFAQAFDFLVKEGHGLPPEVVSRILGEAFVVGYATHTVVKGAAAIPFTVWQGKFK